MLPEQRAERILGDWLERRARGEDVRGEDVLREHPELAEILRPRIEVAVGLNLFAGPGAPTAVPERIGPYRILREVGRGAMGVVYEAEQKREPCRVAIKVLTRADPEAVARFHREVDAAAKLDHPNIVAVHEIGREEPFLFYTMEFVEGSSLDRVIKERCKQYLAGWRPAAEYFRWVAGVFSGVARAVHAAHEKDIIHRDIKPSNILLTSAGVPKVTDFGLARVRDSTANLTETGRILGTLQYMSPEQAAARRDGIDARTDIYSLGATLYECLTLRSPFRGDEPMELISRIISERPVAPRKLERGIPVDLETITLRAIAKDRRRRYQTAAEMAADLQRTLRREPIRARRPGAFEHGYEWVRLHPGRFAAALAVIAAIALGSGAAAAGGRADGLVPPAVNSLASDWAVHGGFDIAAAGIAPDAVVVNCACFVAAPAEPGIAVAFRAPRDKLLDVCAFRQDGECLWSARGAWSDYEATLRQLDMGVSCLQSVVSRHEGEAVEETLCLGLQIASRTDLLMIDPITGVIRGRWRFDGILTQPAGEREVVAPLPDRSGRPRRIMVAGIRDGTPCLSVIEVDGREVQQFGFPLLFELSAKVTDLRADWSRDRPEVTIDTSEGLLASFLVTDRLLDGSNVIALLSDGVPDRYDDAKNETGSFQRLLEASGGRDAYLRDLASAIVEVR